MLPFSTFAPSQTDQHPRPFINPVFLSSSPNLHSGTAYHDSRCRLPVAPCARSPLSLCTRRQPHQCRLSLWLGERAVRPSPQPPAALTIPCSPWCEPRWLVGARGMHVHTRARLCRRLSLPQPWITPSLFDNTGNPNIVDEWTFGQLQDRATAQSVLTQHWNTWSVSHLC